MILAVGLGVGLVVGVMAGVRIGRARFCRRMLSDRQLGGYLLERLAVAHGARVELQQ